MKQKLRSRLKIAIITILALFASITTWFFIYASDYYHAEEIALETLSTNAQQITQSENLTVLSPTIESDTGFIFYPGAKVEAISYLPLLQQIKQTLGITCVIVEMPFNFAFFDINAADDIMAQYPDITNWYIGGHSLGGGMASSYASDNPEKVSGLILMGSYIYGDYPPEKSLTIYGTFNSELEKHINYTENIVIIEGGNHAQFGNYGKQKGDPDATITPAEQQQITVDAISDFIV